ncbi:MULTISPECIES: hypothetical protein [Chitinophagaceae]
MGEILNKDGHGGQSDRERSGWIFTNKKDVNVAFATPDCSIVDIAPTINRFLDVHVQDKNQFEIDGTFFIGKVAVRNLHAEKIGKQYCADMERYCQAENDCENCENMDCQYQ